MMRTDKSPGSQAIPLPRIMMMTRRAMHHPVAFAFLSSCTFELALLSKHSTEKVKNSSVLFLVFYFVAGILYRIYIKGAYFGSSEMLPHRDFWVRFPDHVSNGFTYLKEMVTRRSGGYVAL